ncbi:MAG: hypothetical protein PUG08_08725 [Parafannyhessea umbonata]|nr:hypothetical protein [Parafannyhessea umbonata]MDD6360025.1 hypothetical protein [Parafannyhessea umbonata]MDD6567063.1 hypothetical protein [Parafannyhessea umbonata]MDD6602311.1 hypothetical protein [Parafannyhessea umbonata]MDY4014689.1 hypothetical protein [Parafannyhessea umbonata]
MKILMPESRGEIFGQGRGAVAMTKGSVYPQQAYELGKSLR